MVLISYQGGSNSGEETEGSDESRSEDGSFASVDNLEDDEAMAHKLELEKLAQQDPEFYKYLQENDKELLDFDVSDDEGEELDEDAMDIAEEEGEKAPTLTSDILRRWQKALLEVGISSFQIIVE